MSALVTKSELSDAGRGIQDCRKEEKADIGCGRIYRPSHFDWNHCMASLRLRNPSPQLPIAPGYQLIPDLVL